MAVCPDGWLAEKFEEQLLLGNHWLQEKNQQKVAGLTRLAHHAWRGLYHDNGSCLDIINTVPPDRISALHVVQPDPLTVTDGRHLVTARLDPTCLQHVLSQVPHLSHLPVYAGIAVRKYAIRYTSYGPSRDRLKLILYAGDWLGFGKAKVPAPVPLQRVDPVASVLQRLDRTRYIEDRRRLRPDTVTKHEATLESDVQGLDAREGEDEEVDAILAPTIDQIADMSQTQQPYTQVGFGTQMAPPPTRASEHESRSRGIMAGNTAQNDKQPAVPDNDHRRKELLELLGTINHKPANPPKSPLQDPLGIPAQACPVNPLGKQTSSARNAQVQKTSPLGSNHRKDPTKQVEARSPAVVEAPKLPEATATALDRDDSSNTSIQCPWMKDFVFNSEAMVPDSFQRAVLQNPESWYKPQPGVLPFPARNMPHRWFSKICAIADENAAAQGHTQSDSEEAVDSSPDSDPEEHTIISSAEPGTQAPHDNEPPTSQVSWSASPTPDPPQRPANPNCGLPPDSSLEFKESTMIPDSSGGPLLSNIIPVKENKPSAPPSSPPVNEISSDSDEDMEMETSVPKALGEDTTGVARVSAFCAKTTSSEHGLVKPIVQVEETPQAKIKNMNISPRDQNLENEDVLMSESNTARHSTPGSVKRKLVESPTKPNSRKSKRREFKIVGFGNESPPSINVELALRKDRMESLQRYREERKSSMNFESRLGNPETTETSRIVDEMDIDVSDTPPGTHNFRAMSPRHQGLYDEPSPPRPLFKSESLPNASALSSPAVSLPQEYRAGESPCPSEQSLRGKVEPSIVQASTVFETFRAAYPEYSGNAKHFRGQCTQMNKLDQEDKMVPKWQWDDFIIRHKTDYATYVLMCVEDGEDPEPYHRFYKNGIRDTLYKKGIIDSQRTLLRALEELGAGMPAPPLAKTRQSRADRTSLSSTFHEQKRPLEHRGPHVQRARPRHSLPVESHANQQPPPPSTPFRRPTHSASVRSSIEVQSTSHPNLLSRLAVETPPSVSRTQESTGDKFRDFFMAVQRATSVTGSSKVDPSKPWPQNLAGRPTIADVPKREIDVLAWKDVL